MRDCSIKFLNGLINDNTTKKELEIIKFIKKCVNECCEKKQAQTDVSQRINIFMFWNEQNIIQHKEITVKIADAIDKALKKYSEEEIKTYIERYNKVIKDKTYFFDYKWTLADFLSRKDGISAFTNEGSKWVSYNNQKIVYKKGNEPEFEQRQYTKEDFENIWDNLDDLDKALEEI